MTEVPGTDRDQARKNVEEEAPLVPDDVEGAGAALDAVASDPAGQGRAALDVAREHLDARRVLGRLLEQVAQAGEEPGAVGAVEDAVVAGER